MNVPKHLHRNRLLLARLLGPADPEVACEECFEQLDRYVDLELAGVDADSAMPGLRAHLEGCPACREDYEGLRSFLNVDERVRAAHLCLSGPS
jgi:hypothetical protein